MNCLLSLPSSILDDTIGEEQWEADVKGIRFITDVGGKKTDVVISLKENPELWEDIYDRSLARKRAREPRESLESVKRRLSARKVQRTRG
jgi:hypothetical protein